MEKPRENIVLSVEKSSNSRTWFRQPATTGKQKNPIVSQPVQRKVNRVTPVQNAREPKQKKIPALGHTEVIDEAIAPTCEEAGKTAGIRCSVCNEIIKAQEEVPATGHKEVIDEAVDPTCEKTGKTEGSHCKTCEKVLKAQKRFRYWDHKEAEIITKEATCEEEGNILVYCSTCRESFKLITKRFRPPATEK